LTHRTEGLFQALDKHRQSGKEDSESIKKTAAELRGEAEKTKEEFWVANKVNTGDMGEGLKGLQRRLDRETTRLKENESKVVVQLEERFGRLREELGQHDRNRHQLLSQFVENADEEIDRLWEELRINEEESGAQAGEIAARIDVTKRGLLGQVEAERAAREENEKAIYDMMKEVMEKIKDELAKEHEERVKTEEVIMGLLDEVTRKLKTLTA
jgi:hypothetical protein